MKRIIPWLNQYTSPAIQQIGLLFAVDMVGNVLDYAFHLFLGRALVPGDFAIVQTINSTILIVGTAFAVLQPVVARYVAESSSEQPEQARGVFQLFFWQSVILGAILTGLGWWGQRPLSQWLNVPVMAITLSAALLLMAWVRPVVVGMLQGQQRFFYFGLVRTILSGGRLLLALILIGILGGGAIAGVGAMLVGGFLSLFAGMLLVGRAAWKPVSHPPYHLVREGWQLSLAALLAYLAFTSLQGTDLIWANRIFAPELAGSYASAAVLRRVLALLPGATVIILYPRVVVAVTQKQLPDKLLGQVALIILATNIPLTVFYFWGAPWLVQFVFGPGYEAAIPLLGWMGLAMLGYSLGAIWLNVFLATEPWLFVGLLVFTAVTQLVLFAFVTTVWGLLWAFAGGGLVLALGGMGLYLGWLRPQLKANILA